MNGEECLKTKKVLYVEDDVATSEVVARLLKRVFADVSVAYNGKEAFDMFMESTPDMVITDIEMPVMNGLQLLAKIKEINPKKPVVIVTGFEDEANRAKDADAVLIKPISKDELKGALFEVCVKKLG